MLDNIYEYSSELLVIKIAFYYRNVFFFQFQFILVLRKELFMNILTSFLLLNKCSDL